MHTHIYTYTQNVWSSSQWQILTTIVAKATLLMRHFQLFHQLFVVSHCYCCTRTSWLWRIREQVSASTKHAHKLCARILSFDSMRRRQVKANKLADCKYITACGLMIASIFPSSDVYVYVHVRCAYVTSFRFYPFQAILSLFGAYQNHLNDTNIVHTHTIPISHQPTRYYWFEPCLGCKIALLEKRMLWLDESQSQWGVI